MKSIRFSIVIPVRESAAYLPISLGAVMAQSGASFEAIIADNESHDGTPELAKRMGAKVVRVAGSPPMVCQQRNAGGRAANGEYIIFLDHDMELPSGFLRNLDRQVASQPQVGAWYIPERMRASSMLLGNMRTFENSCYEHTPIVAARVIKRSVYLNTSGYDTKLSSGPADWDFDLRLRMANVRFGTVQGHLIHHEESLGYWDYVKKKTRYKSGIEIYKKKWKSTDPVIYEKYVRKQFSPWYRLIVVFFEEGKWIRTLQNLHLYILFLVTRFFMVWYY